MSERWRAPEEQYRRWAAEGPAGGFELGAAQFVPVELDRWVANKIGQRGVRRSPDGQPPIR